MQPDDELTHRLWWKLGDYLRGEMAREDFFAWLADLSPHSVEPIQAAWFADGPITRLSFEEMAAQRRQRLESLYSEMTWELLGVVV